jgi:hypothetical protein
MVPRETDPVVLLGDASLSWPSNALDELSLSQSHAE